MFSQDSEEVLFVSRCHCVMILTLTQAMNFDL